jgi:hypothetical protein
MTNVDEVLTAAARISFAAGEHGNFRGVDPLLARLASMSDPHPQVWSLALRAIRWSFDPAAVVAPQPTEARGFVEHPLPIRQIAARACSVMERACIRTFDVVQLGIWIDVHAALDEAREAASPTNKPTKPRGKGATEPDKKSELELDKGSPAGVGDAPSTSATEPGTRDVGLWSAQLWQRLLLGETAGQEVEAKALFDEASRQRAAPQVIESTVLRALLALSAGATDDAVDMARRASRMAQSESLPQLEYLANVTLARVRRYSGRPHLALHILAALLRVAPPAWAGWIGWEMLLGGGEGARKDNPGSTIFHAPAMVAERNLAALIAAARGGDRTEFVEAAAVLEKSASVWPDLQREVQTLLAALDPMREMIPDTALPWSRGETATIPCGLHGVGIPQGSGPESEGATAFVVARPGALGRRFLRPGLAFVPEARLLARDSAKSVAGGVRTETGIAALALAGEAGTTREVFFRNVYGFPFVAHRHQAVLDVLCHRMRNLLGDAGEVRRDSGEGSAAAAGPKSGSTTLAGPSLALLLKTTIVVPDMRCALPTADRVLRALATLGTTSASTAADSLRMPLRTVQAVLQQLVAEGACSIERDGRRVAYKIEDTTFTEVTSA